MLGVAPTWGQFFIAIPIAMLAYTGVETVSNLAEEVRDPARAVPNAYKLVAAAVFAIYLTLPAVALSALPVVQDADGDYVDEARACRRKRAASRTTPCSASSTGSASPATSCAGSRSTSACSPPRSCSSPRTRA